jgi:hypothetical protein
VSPSDMRREAWRTMRAASRAELPDLIVAERLLAAADDLDTEAARCRRLAALASERADILREMGMEGAA